MKIARCPGCGAIPPWSAQFCARCGKSLSTPVFFVDPDESQVPTIRLPDGPALLKTPRFFATVNDDTQRIDKSNTATIKLSRKLMVLSSDEPAGSAQDQDEEDDEPEHHATWNKVVHYKTRRFVPALLPPPPAPPSKPTPPSGSTYLPAPLLLQMRRAKSRKWTPGLIFWISVLAMVGLLFGGVFGKAITFGSTPGSASAQKPNLFSLQVTPSSIALGGLITLRGSSFTPGGRVGLTRDMNIPVANVDGSNIIRADAHGSFSSSVFVDPAWQAGTHILRAEDAVLHKTATFTVSVTGHSTSLRPPHLLLSTASLNLGIGDQATNSLKAVKLSNTGGGIISWQSAVTQPWLELSPRNGMFASGQNMSIMVAVDRANLKPGAYNASVIFTANTGLITLAVQMNVTPLQPGNKAALQLTPAVLAFTGNDGGTDPPAQVVTVSDPGPQPLYWGVTSSASDPGNWLSISPQGGGTPSHGSQPVQVSVSLNALLPGVYTGWITFTNQGQDAVIDSPQAIFVSLTVVPQCTVQVQPGALAFTGAYAQPGALSQAINIGMSQSCAAPLHWNASLTTNNGGSWLSMSKASGVTPAASQVFAQPAGLGPGTYTGAVVFNAGAGTQTVPVTLTIGQASAPILMTAPQMLNFGGVMGQPDPAAQTLTLTNTGGGTLSWHAAAATAVGGAWLSITPTTGSLDAHQSALLTVTTTLLPALIPGIYNGSITITGSDGYGNTAVGSPLTIAVAFGVQAACAISTLPTLTFQGVAGQPDPAPQSAAITARGACAHVLTWTATATVNTPSGGNWLNASPPSGSVSRSQQGSTAIAVTLSGLGAGTYTGQVNISTVDSVTHQQVGQAKISVTLNVQPPCTLLAPSITSAPFSTEAGLNPSPQNFTIGVTGTCAGSVTITPTVGSGASWLSVSPSSASVSSGGTATFTIAVNAQGLTPATYTANISLAAVDNGITITGSPSLIKVSLAVNAPPTLNSSSGPLTFNVTTGSSSQPISFNNTGAEPLNWTVALDAGTPGFISLSATSGSALTGGSSASIDVTVDATGQTGGSTVSTHVTITATDPLTGNTIAGSPISIPVTINISPPQMQLSSNSLTFNTVVGGALGDQAIGITNTGGDTLTWMVGTPSASWLTVTSSTTSATSGQGATLTFKVDVTGLAAGTYNATVDITPTSGSTATIAVALTVN